jgi:hypothetical protein
MNACRKTALLSASVMLAYLMLVSAPVPAAKPGGGKKKREKTKNK